MENLSRTNKIDLMKAAVAKASSVGDARAYYCMMVSVIEGEEIEEEKEADPA